MKHLYSARFYKKATKPFTVYAGFRLDYDPDLSLKVSDEEAQVAKEWFDNELRARGITPKPWEPEEPIPSERLMPMMSKIIQKVDAIPPSTEPGADIEVGIYGRSIRVWRVFRGI